MSRMALRDKIKGGLLLLDGAMGTQLIARCAKTVTCNDYLNIESPDTIFDIHQNYLEAGSDAVLTNTFGGNKYSLARHGLADRLEDINIAGARIARRAAGDEKYVLGDIGPTGDFLEPLGGIKPDELRQAFTLQAAALVKGCVDGFIIETMTALDETKIAVEAVKSVSDLPLFVSFSYNPASEGFRTMMGIEPVSIVTEIAALAVDAVGFNCGSLSMDQYIELAKTYVRQTEGGMALLAEPNAGKPRLVEDSVVYDVSPQKFAAAMEKIHSTGVSIIGGCCGTSPEHIKAVAKRLRK